MNLAFNHKWGPLGSRLPRGFSHPMSPASSRVVSHSEDFIDRNAATKGLPRDPSIVEGQA
ncbi:hypothetical protein KY289_018604 [Solanum tuberosum]|nr:hypothetical protein KY289_018604 [Solanum tuberosum]